MKTAIIYMSKHGTTEKITKLLSDKIENSTMFNLSSSSSIVLENYDTIIIGGSIHFGSMQKKLKQFIAKNIDVLLTKRTALFMVCMDKTDKRNEQFENAYPQELRNRSIVNGYFRGEFIFDKMNFIEKIIIKKISGRSTDVSEIDYEAIDEFVNKLIN
ncbi:MAG: flavodoxin domain-containing protein [Candidatus Tenebribacter davisii]|nr:flavodoxin domain-containing protein [Candidatus Tenebribacter davisii]